MRLTLIALLLIGCAPPATIPAPTPPAGARTLTIVTGTNCLACTRMKRTLADPQVRAALKRYNVVSLDTTADAGRIPGSVTAIPAFLITDGPEVITQAEGYFPPRQFVAWLNQHARGMK